MKEYSKKALSIVLSSIIISSMASMVAISASAATTGENLSSSVTCSQSDRIDASTTETDRNFFTNTETYDTEDS
jgi:hypothetical protein